MPAIRPLFHFFNTDESNGTFQFRKRKGYSIHMSPGHPLTTFSEGIAESQRSEYGTTNQILSQPNGNLDYRSKTNEATLALGSVGGIRKTTEVELKVDPRGIV